MDLRGELLTTRDGGLLEGVRQVLHSSEEALLCVAFVQEGGVRLLERELKSLGGRARLLATTTFGSTNPGALNLALELGTSVRILDPGGTGTYHPKVYVGRGAGVAHAVVGSPNLTRGLSCNIEAAWHAWGDAGEPALQGIWEYVEGLWRDPRARAWERGGDGPDTTDLLEPELHALIQAEVARDPVFRTLHHQRPNRVAHVDRLGVLVQTQRSDRHGGHPERVDAWMLNLAWDYLRTHGSLTNAHLLNVLRVHRSSAVCAVLARLPSVRQGPGPHVALEWRGAAKEKPERSA